MFNKQLKLGSTVFSTVMALSLVLATPLNVAAASNTIFSDNFNHTYLHPDQRAKWWVINAAYNASTNSQGFFEDFCGPSSCFVNAKEGNEKFARLQLYPGNTPGYFVNVDVAEEHTGYPSEINNNWLPTVNRPVEMVTKVRWSDTYNQTGTAGARGTNGVWLWDSPYDFANYDPEAPLNAFGFNYAPYDTLGGYAAGLQITVMSFGFPVILTQFPMQINMQEWNEFRFVWSVDANGVQSIQVSANGQDAGTYTLPYALPALSTEIWQDNEFANFNQYGGVSISYDSIPQEQHFDLSQYTVRYLGE